MIFQDLTGNKNKLVFIDTNVLVYAYDEKNQQKQRAARDIIASAPIGLVVISTQVLQEFYNTITTKLQVDKFDAKEIVRRLTQYTVINNNIEIIQNAIEISMFENISFWDALLFAAASAANCKFLLTEDLNHNQIIRGVKIVNPFEAD